MSSNNINITLKGVDKTSQAFDKVSQKSKSIGKGMSSVSSTIGASFGKLLAIGAVVKGVQMLGRAILDTAAHYANLADSAAQAHVSSASAFEGLVRSLDTVGLKGMTIDNVAKAFSRMTKATGVTDIDGFISELERISQLGTEQERLNESIRVFGKEAGVSFAVVARGGKQAINAIAQMTHSWDNSSDSQINAFAEIDGAWVRICEDMKQTQVNMLGSMMESLIGTSEVTELNIMLLYEKIKLIFLGVGRAIIDPFRAAFAAVSSMFYGFIGVVADGLAWVVDLWDKEAAAAMDDYATRQYDAALEWVDVGAEAGENIQQNLQGKAAEHLRIQYEQALEKWKKLYALKGEFDDAVGLNGAAENIADAADDLSKAAANLKALKTTNFVGAGTAEALKIRTISRDWVNSGDRGTSSSVQIGQDIVGVLRTECRRIEQTEADILYELRQREGIGAL